MALANGVRVTWGICKREASLEAVQSRELAGFTAEEGLVTYVSRLPLVMCAKKKKIESLMRSIPDDEFGKENSCRLLSVYWRIIRSILATQRVAVLLLQFSIETPPTDSSV